MNKARLPHAPVGGKARSLLGVDDLQQVHLPQLELRRAHREVDHPWATQQPALANTCQAVATSGCQEKSSREVKP